MAKHVLLAAILLTGTVPFFAARAQGMLTAPKVPAEPSEQQIEQNLPALGNSLNTPITGASEQPGVVGVQAPPSLEALQAARPNHGKKRGLKPGRAAMLRTAALTYGAQGGLAAESFAINEMLRRYRPELDQVFNFAPLVLPVGTGETLMRPPIVSAAQMAFALGDGGQIARETSCVYQITRNAALASTPPNWREYLVRTWQKPMRPTDAALPRTPQEVAYWNKWVAEGWADGEKQGDEIFLDDLGRLRRTIIGMARYRVLLRAGLVEPPTLAFHSRAVD
ncbi:MAG: type IV secretory system conjugative DNA transfer family protein, partial [Acetobacteraceae bacterium]